MRARYTLATLLVRGKARVAIGMAERPSAGPSRGSSWMLVPVPMWTITAGPGRLGSRPRTAGEDAVNTTDISIADGQCPFAAPKATLLGAESDSMSHTHAAPSP